MTPIYFLCVLFILSKVSKGQDCPKDSFYVNEIASCVHPDNDVSPMGYAEIYCQAFGGHLLSVNNSFMNSLITGIQLTNLQGAQGFIGATRKNGVWSWTDGSPWTYQRWALGQPAAGDCVTLDSNAYTWRTVDCSQNYPYLCGIPNIIQPDCTATQIPILCPSGSFFVEETQSCLHADNNAVSFFLAEKYCQAYNGHLYSIHDGNTDDFITGVSYTLINRDQFWIGAQKNLSDFGWTDGTAFDYTNWGSGEPKSDCGIIQRESAAWEAVSCTTTLPFMCNIPPIINGGCTTTSAPQPPTSEPMTDTTTDSPSTSTTTTTTTTTSVKTCIAPTKLTCKDPSSEQMYNCYSGWQCFPPTGYLYKVGFDKKFNDAQSACISDGGHLASLHSQAEDDFIRSLCCETSCDIRTGDGWDGVFTIGGKKVSNSWTWVDGTPFDYKRNICDQGGDVLYTNSPCHDCGGVLTEWATFGVDDNAPPYYVCKKPNL